MGLTGHCTHETHFGPQAQAPTRRTRVSALRTAPRDPAARAVPYLQVPPRRMLKRLPVRPCQSPSGAAATESVSEPKVIAQLPPYPCNEGCTRFWHAPASEASVCAASECRRRVDKRINFLI